PGAGVAPERRGAGHRPPVAHLAGRGGAHLPAGGSRPRPEPCRNRPRGPMKRRKFLKSLPGLRRVLMYLGPSLRKQRLLLATSMCAFLAEAFFRALEPWPLKWIIALLFRAKGHTGPPATPAPGGLDPTTLIALAALAIIVFRGLRSLAAYGNRVGFAQVS